jgi:hypothetical protein
MKKLLRLVLLLPLAFNFIPSAQAAEQVQTELVGLTPEWLNRPSVVEISLVVSSETAVADIPVQIELSAAPLAGRSEISLARTNQLDIATKVVLETTQNMGAGTNLWTLKIPAKQFVDTQNGIYLIEVQLGNEGKFGIIQTLLPVLRDQFALEPVPTVVLWEISSSPVSSQPGQFISKSAVDQFTNQTNISLQAAVGRSALSVLVNPATLVDAQRLAVGGEIQNPEPTGVSEEAVTAAANWLTQYREIMTGKDFYYLPYADADLNGLWFKNQNALAAAALKTLDLVQTDLPMSVNTGAVIPDRGDFAERVWKQHANDLPGLVVVRSDRFAALDESFTPAGIVSTPAGTKALVVDQAATSALSAAMVEHTAVKGKQAVLSETLMIALERPNDARLLVLDPDTLNPKISLAATTAALDSLIAPWIAPLSAKQALELPATVDRIHKSGERKPVFNESALRTIWDTNRTYANLDALIAGSIHEFEYRAAVLRSVSQAALLPKTQTQLQLAARSFTNSLANAVSIVSAGTVAFAGESGIVPITIKNELSIPVTVQVQADGVPSVRVIPDSIELVTIQPGQRKSIEIPTTLRGSDSAFLDLQLISIDGDEIGRSVRIQLTSSAYSKIAAVFVYGASALLLLMIVLNIVKRFRAGKAAGEQHD